MLSDSSELPADQHRAPTPTRARQGAWELGIGSWELSAALLVSCAVLAGCGKKGPPLAPIVHVPAAVDKVSARRVGNDIYVSLAIPTQNIDSSTPADVSRVDVYGATSLTPPPLTRFFEIASRVASVDVQPAPPRGDTAAPAPATGSPALPVQGTMVTLRDVLTAEALQPKALSTPATREARATAAVTPSTAPAPAFPRRYYVAVAISDRGRQGPPGTLADVPLSPLPDPPGALSLSATEDRIAIAWEPSGGIVGFLFEKPPPPEIAPVDELPEGNDRLTRPAEATPAGPTLYNVYREPAGGQSAARGTDVTWPAAPAEPINPAPLTDLTFTDSSPFQFGQERCYTVRAVRGAGASLAVSAASPPECITPVDTYAPQPPTGLVALGAEGVINLSWEPNGEADLAGYLVLRGRAGDATLQPLTGTPIMDTRYTDRDVMAGVRYVYAVEAVDMQQPPNVSGESNRVEETPR